MFPRSESALRTQPIQNLLWKRVVFNHEMYLMHFLTHSRGEWLSAVFIVNSRESFSFLKRSSDFVEYISSSILLLVSQT